MLVDSLCSSCRHVKLPPIAKSPGRPRIELGVSSAELVEQYESGMTINALAAAHGVHPKTIRVRIRAELERQGAV